MPGEDAPSHTGTLTLVDGHVHLHEDWDVEAFLLDAHRNFSRVSQTMGHATFTGVLALVDAEGQNGYRRIVAEARSLPRAEMPAWTFEATEERVSTRLVVEDSSLVIIAGRQLRSAENLEVLAVGVDAAIAEGRPLKDLITDVADAGGIPIVPWGFGKWSGRRGAILREHIESSDVPFFLGDNANRPSALRRPALFETALLHGRRIIPGSDPLPFSRESHRAGTFGLALQGELDPRFPAADLKARLFDPALVARPFGELEQPLRFARNQTAMQLKRVGAYLGGRG